MTGVPAPKPNAYRPWSEIAAELASVRDLAKALELAHELNCALAQQSSVPEKEKAAEWSMTEEQLSLVLP
jgi:hypothetical protein